MKRKSDWLAEAIAPKIAGSIAVTGIKPPPLVNGSWHYPILRITCANLSSETAVEGGYGGVFGSVSADEKCHLIDISVSIPTLGTDGTTDVVFGRQIVGALKTNDNSGSLSYAIAKATLKTSRNTLTVETTGLADSATVAIRKMAGQTLTAESAKSFGEGIGDCLKWVVENAKLTGAAARPAPLFQSTPSYDEVISICFGLGQIAKGNSLDDALAALKDYHVHVRTRETYATVEPAIVAAIYHRFRVTSRPTAVQTSQADAVLRGTGGVPSVNKAEKAFYKAVLPYVRTDGAILSLAHLADAARIKAQPWPPASEELTSPKAQIGNDDLSFNTALDIGLGILGDVHLNSDFRFCGFRSWSTYRRSGAANTIILHEFYGAGIRASIRYSGSEIKGGATQVAAKVTLDSTAASFSIDVMGVDISQLPSVGAFASGAATVFDSQTLSLIGGIWSEANTVITAHDNEDPAIPSTTKAAWQPCLTGVNLNLGADEFQEVTGRCGAWVFALRKLEQRVSREAALNSAPDAFCKAAVQKIYGEVSQPDSGARNAARSKLQVGR
jgi:hypothetical protein